MSAVALAFTRTPTLRAWDLLSGRLCCLDLLLTWALQLVKPRKGRVTGRGKQGKQEVVQVGEWRSFWIKQDRHGSAVYSYKSAQRISLQRLLSCLSQIETCLILFQSL